MTRRRARAEALELREDEPHPMALLTARRELGADLREDSLLGVDEALQAEWIAHRTSCRHGCCRPEGIRAGRAGITSISCTRSRSGRSCPRSVPCRWSERANPRSIHP